VFFVYACVRVCTWYACLCVCVSVCAFKCVFVLLHMHNCVAYACMRTCACVFICACVHVPFGLRNLLCVHTYVCVYVSVRALNEAVHFLMFVFVQLHGGMGAVAASFLQHLATQHGALAARALWSKMLTLPAAGGDFFRAAIALEQQQLEGGAREAAATGVCVCVRVCVCESSRKVCAYVYECVRAQCVCVRSVNYGPS
jgi:hypothetical protein